MSEIVRQITLHLKGCQIEDMEEFLCDVADEIERLRSKNERLREALELADGALSGANMNMKVVERKVRAALEEEKK